VYLSQIPYTGFADGLLGPIVVWGGLIVWSAALAYLFVTRRRREKSLLLDIRSFVSELFSRKNEEPAPVYSHVNHEELAQTIEFLANRERTLLSPAARSFLTTYLAGVPERAEEVLMHLIAIGRAKYQLEDNWLLLPVERVEEILMPAVHRSVESTLVPHNLPTGEREQKDIPSYTGIVVPDENEEPQSERTAGTSVHAGTAVTIARSLLAGEYDRVLSSMRIFDTRTSELVALFAEAVGYFEILYRERRQGMLGIRELAYGAGVPEELRHAAAAWDTAHLEELVHLLASGVDQAHRDQKTAITTSLLRAVSFARSRNATRAGQFPAGVPLSVLAS
jgi:hypothetical protein